MKIWYPQQDAPIYPSKGRGNLVQVGGTGSMVERFTGDGALFVLQTAYGKLARYTICRVRANHAA